MNKDVIYIIDSALSVEDTSLENTVTPFTFSISRTEDLVNNGNVTNMTGDDGNIFFLLYDQSTEDNAIIKDGTCCSGDVEQMQRSIIVVFMIHLNLLLELQQILH